MINLDNCWLEYLVGEFDKNYMKKIKSFLESEIEIGKIIYPQRENIFNALNTTSIHNVKVVIIGQDPYHGVGQANGLSFSVQQGIKVPPSLKNIYKEILSDSGKEAMVSKGGKSGDLSSWAKQGVLLLNTILTVEAGKPASHSKIGWQNFTNKVIKTVSKEKEGIVFLLWGAYAQNKKDLINTDKHYILETSHPSPFSAHRGFLGSKHFSKTNEILKKQGKNEIKW